MIDGVHIYIKDLPHDIKGFTVPDADGYTVYLNAHCSREQNGRTLLHELQHINRDDCYSLAKVGVLEGCL